MLDEGNDLSVLVEAVEKSSDAVFASEGQKWTTMIVRLLHVSQKMMLSPKFQILYEPLYAPQETGHITTLHGACRVISAIVTRAHLSPGAMRDFSSHQLPAIVQSLLRFSAAADDLQVLVLPVVAQSLVCFPSPMSQFKVLQLDLTLYIDSHTYYCIAGCIASVVYEGPLWKQCTTSSG